MEGEKRGSMRNKMKFVENVYNCSEIMGIPINLVRDVIIEMDTKKTIGTKNDGLRIRNDDLNLVEKYSKWINWKIPTTHWIWFIESFTMKINDTHGD